MNANKQDAGGLHYTDHNVTNGLLCDFGTRWIIDGDYIRCRTCGRPQLTSYAENDFPHASSCCDKDSPTMERRPWLRYLELLEPLRNGEQCRAASVELEELRAWKAEHQAFLVRLSVALVVDGGCKQDQIEACVDELIAERDNLRALSRGVPEGMVLVPVEPTPEMETAHRMYGDTSDWWQAVTSAAIAAQRKEGD